MFVSPVVYTFYPASHCDGVGTGSMFANIEGGGYYYYTDNGCNTVIDGCGFGRGFEQGFGFIFKAYGNAEGNGFGSGHGFAACDHYGRDGGAYRAHDGEGGGCAYGHFDGIGGGFTRARLPL